MRLRLPLLLSCCLALLVATSATPSAEASAKDDDVRVIRASGPGGIGKYVGGRWGMVSVELANPSDKPAKVLLAVFFLDQDAGLQYARRFWIPAKTRRRSWLPLLVPELPVVVPEKNKVEEKEPEAAEEEKNEKLGKRINVGSVLIREEEGGEVRLVRPGQDPVQTGMLMRPPRGPVTAIVYDGFDEEPLRVIAAARQSRNLPITVPRLPPNAMPPTAAMLDGLDHLVLADDMLANDPAAMLAVRRWLHAGGRMWLMLDRVEPILVEQLLGDRFGFSVVDSVDICHLTLEGPRTDGLVRTFADPVKLVRTVLDGVEPIHTVGGWPASFYLSAGRGKVLVTTLDARAWYRARNESDLEPPKWFGPSSPYASTGPAEFLAVDLLTPREEPLLTASTWEDYVGKKLGHRVASRGLVAGWLLGFCGALGIASVVLVRCERLSWLGWMGPAMAGIAAIGLWGIGYASRTSVEASSVAGRLVQITPGVEDLHVEGVAAVYHPNGSTRPMATDSGEWFLPSAADQPGTMRRMVVEDVDRWQWENLPLPAGVSLAGYTSTEPVTEPISVRATFGPDGVEGTFQTGSFGACQDAVLAGVMRRNLAVRLEADGSLRAEPDDLLAPGDYLGGQIVSDEGNRRQRVYRALLGEGMALPESSRQRPPWTPSEPTLLAWTSIAPTGVGRLSELPQDGGTLLMVPVTWERPVAGTRVTIPSALVRMRSVPFPGRKEISPAFDNRSGRWLPGATTARVLLEFTCPDVVMPLRVEGVRLWVTIRAPKRTFSVLGLRQGKVVELDRRESPTGTLRFEFDADEAPQPGENGGVRIGFVVGEAPEETAAREAESGARVTVIQGTRSGWVIDEARLELSGTVQ